MSRIEPQVPSTEVNVAEFFDPESTTCGIADAIASLPKRGGRVRIPAGTYVLRRSVYVPGGVSLAGDGPATVLTIPPLRTVFLTVDLRKGGRVLTCRTRPPFRVGEEIGVCDDQRRGWWGTHGIVERIEDRRVWMSVPFNRSQQGPGKWPAIRLHDLDRSLVQGNRCPDQEGRSQFLLAKGWWRFTTRFECQMP